jgi:spermidine synthase
MFSLSHGSRALKNIKSFDWVILISFYLSGYAALTYEQLWTQLLSLIYGSSTYAFSIMLAAFFGGLAIGSIIMWRYIDRVTRPILWFATVELGIGLVSLALLPGFSNLDVPYLYALRNLDSPYLIMLTWILIPSLLVIPTALMGATLPLASRIFVTQKERIGTNVGILFSTNTFGGIFASWWTGFVLLPNIGLERTYVLAVSANIAVAVLLLFHAEESPSTELVRKSAYSLAALSIFWGGVIGFQEFDPTSAGVYYMGTSMTLEEWRELKANSKILYNKYGVYGLVTVGEDANVRHLSVNGKPEASNGPFDLETQYLLAYIPMLAHPAPKEALQIGVGAGFTLSAMANFPVDKIDAVEINPLVIEAAKMYFSEETDYVLEDPRVRLIVEDGRKYLATTTEKYDVIVSTPSNPWVSGVSSLFTLEFYEAARERLKDDGILAVWAPLYEYVPGDIKILLRTVLEAFPNVQVFTSGGDMIILASEDRISFDYKRLDMELDRPEIRRDFSRIRVLSDAPISAKDEDKVLSTFKLGPEDVKRYVAGAELNTDDRPVLEFKAARHGLMKKGDTATESLHSIFDFKTRNGLTVFEPPITSTRIRQGNMDIFPYMRLEVIPKDEHWILEDAKFEYIHTISPDGVVLYYDNKYVVYRLPGEGLLAVQYIEIFPEPDRATVEGYIWQLMAPITLEFIGTEEGIGHHPRMIYNLTLPVGNLRGIIHTWYCKDNTALYIAAEVSPNGIKDGKAIDRAICLHGEGEMPPSE